MYQESRIADFFTTEVPNFAASLATDTDYGWFVHALFVLFVFILVVKEMTHFVRVGADTMRIVSMVVLVFVVLLFLESFTFLTSMAWEASVGLREAVQNAATGEPSSLALGDYLDRSVNSLETEDISIWDSVVDWLAALMFSFITMILKAVIWVGSQWALLGYSFCVIVGPLFIPLLLLETTRPMFNGFLQLFFGFLIYNFFVGVVLSLVVLFFKYVIYGVPATDWSISGIALTLSECVDMAVYLLLFVLLTLSITTLSSTVAGAGVSATQGAAKLAMMTLRMRLGR